MNGEEFRVQNYKCINDSGWVDLEDLTCFIGKNQSGKTAFLEAINRINPVYNSPEFDHYEDYPRGQWTEYRERHETDPDVVVEAKLTLEEEEIAEIEREFGSGFIVDPEVQLKKDYKNRYIWNIQLDESEYIQSILDDYDLPTRTMEMLSKADRISDLADKIEDSEAQDQQTLNQIMDKIDDGTKSPSDVIGGQFLKGKLPEFLYMGEYHFLKDEISMDKLVKKQNQDELDEGDEIFLALLSLGSLEPTELRDDDDWRKIRTQLESAANRVTEYVLEYWSQNENFRIEFDRNYATEDGIFYYQKERVVEVLVENLDYRATIPFNQQSRGFRWFFSVFCLFTELQDREDDLVILLDEPGLHLHARAQQDFLNFLNDELSTLHSVIYTTHSPFMIDPRNLHRAKMVISDPDRGTNISTDVMRTDEETRFPLQNVFEFDLVDTLLIRPQTLLVEGKSDHSFLYTMSEILDEMGRECLDRQWTVLPVGSGSNVPTFVSLFGGNDLDLAVLIDGDSQADQRREHIESKGVMESENIKDITDFINSDYCDIEDLFSTAFYMTLVNETYRAEISEVTDIPERIDVSDFKEDNKRPRIVKRLEKYFDRYYINEGEFEHYAPAKYFEDNRDLLKEELDEESIANFEEVFTQFNSILNTFN